MSREEHVQAVLSAEAALEELQTIIGMARAKADEAVVQVNDAIGDTGNTSAVDALDGLVGVRTSLSELAGSLEVSVQKMRDYGGGI